MQPQRTETLYDLQNAISASTSILVRAPEHGTHLGVIGLAVAESEIDSEVWLFYGME